MMTNREVGIFEENWDREFCGSFGGDRSELGRTWIRDVDKEGDISEEAVDEDEEKGSANY